jgi:hypothetical protein
MSCQMNVSIPPKAQSPSVLDLSGASVVLRRSVAPLGKSCRERNTSNPDHNDDDGEPVAQASVLSGYARYPLCGSEI